MKIQFIIDTISSSSYFSLYNHNFKAVLNYWYIEFFFFFINNDFVRNMEEKMEGKKKPEEKKQEKFFY